MLDMDTYDEPDPESDYDYEESYSSKRKRRKPRGGGHHPARNHPPTTDSPGAKRTKVSATCSSVNLYISLRFLLCNLTKGAIRNV